MMTSRFTLIAAAAIWGLSAQPSSAHGPDKPDHDHHGGAAHGATSTDGGPGNPSEVSRTVRIEAKDIGFMVKQIQVKAAETIKFVVTNKGQLPHEFAIASAKEHEEHSAMMAEMPDMVHEEPNVVSLKPGETRELVWKFGNDTNLEFSCNLPGHREQGMKGTFRVMR
jgi:uncharacterized cupredoxin-like copper-binding protein